MADINTAPYACESMMLTLLIPFIIDNSLEANK